ncbi:flavin monoamine oxidase family protein [Sphingomonas bacterium]|uniref:flavin monoamine oxidase family protein n=1 Tax=Sphingomonas bacterium TaxID=1895847 RepID=UPI0015753450|nr:NAD(P)/FAD-dependent oxidoreductase [Sphingomonas bacterium]
MTGTVVIGGGAAGIAAARTLHDAGEDVLLVEAKGRLGGRAHSMALSSLVATDAALPDWVVPLLDDRHVDLGCGWLHSASRNPWTGIAEREGLAVDRSSPHWHEQWQDLGFPADDQRAFGEAFGGWQQAAYKAAAGPDRSLASIPADPRWRPMLDAISGYANGAQLRDVSLHDWHAYDDASDDDNWAVVEGYGTLIASHARGSVRLGTPVRRIDHRGRTLLIETDVGTIAAERAIVCMPSATLGAIVFDPPLPDKQDAAAALPLGLADKVFIAVDRPDWPAHAHLVGDPNRVCTASHRLSPFGWPIVESFFGGDCAEALEDEHAACAFAVDELVALLGSDWRARLHPLAATRWRHEPFIGGSYSHALVSRAGERQVLAEPVDDRLFFAGEACSRTDFSTAHGAYQTGVDAARAVLALRTEVAIQAGA